jgi:hypothetical protein
MGNPAQLRPILFMKKESKRSNEAQLLDLLKRVLPKATDDAQLADRIYLAIKTELETKARALAFEKFCGGIELPNLEQKTVDDVKLQLAASFDVGDITLKPNKKEKSLMVELSLPEGGQYSSEIKVGPPAAVSDEEQELVAKFVPFPVCLAGDKELVWLLAKSENLSPEEAAIALSKVEEDFWASKTGQKLLRDRVERSFPEFIARVPSGLLTEVGLKRHYKDPEPIKPLRNAPQH